MNNTYNERIDGSAWQKLKISLKKFRKDETQKYNLFLAELLAFNIRVRRRGILK